MKFQTLRSVRLLILFLPMSGCAGVEAAHHEYVMRGQILEMQGDTAYLCVGSKDGAHVGQQMTVYKFVPRPPVGKADGGFKRIQTGTVKIVQVVDEHMATATVVSGEAKVNNVVEMEP